MMKRVPLFLIVIAFSRAPGALAKEEPTDQQLRDSAKRMSCALKVCKKLERASQLSPPFIDINHCAGVKANEKPCKTRQSGQNGHAQASAGRTGQ